MGISISDSACKVGLPSTFCPELSGRAAWSSYRTTSVFERGDDFCSRGDGGKEGVDRVAESWSAHWEGDVDDVPVHCNLVGGGVSGVACGVWRVAWLHRQLIRTRDLKFSYRRAQSFKTKNIPSEPKCLQKSPTRNATGVIHRANRDASDSSKIIPVYIFRSPDDRLPYND